MTKTYIICSRVLNDEFEETHIMHKLCMILNQMGYRALMLYPGGQIIFNDYNVPIATQMSACHDIYYNDAIVIYPNNFHGNYLKAKNIIRFIFNDDHNLVYPKKEKVYCFTYDIFNKIKNKDKQMLYFPIKSMPNQLDMADMIRTIKSFIERTQC